MAYKHIFSQQFNLIKIIGEIKYYFLYQQILLIINIMIVENVVYI